jgi:hypothetical protein
MARFVDAIITYRILRMLTTAFTDTDAYRLGIIDAHGAVIKKEQDLATEEERESYTLLHRMVFKLKRIIEKVPFENKRFLSFAAAIALVKENAEYDEDILEEIFYMTMEQDETKSLAEQLESDTMLSFKDFISEDGMGVAGGAIAGIGINNPSIPNQAEPGVSKSKQKKYKKKNAVGSPVMIRRK